MHIVDSTWVKYLPQKTTFSKIIYMMGKREPFFVFNGYNGKFSVKKKIVKKNFVTSIRENWTQNLVYLNVKLYHHHFETHTHITECLIWNHFAQRPKYREFLWKKAITDLWNIKEYLSNWTLFSVLSLWAIFLQKKTKISWIKYSKLCTLTWSSFKPQ